MPIALSSDRIAKLENTDAGKTVLSTLLIQTKLKGVNAQTIKQVLEASQKRNQQASDDYEKQAHEEQKACAADINQLKNNHQEAIQKRYNLEKTNEQTTLLKDRKSEYAKSLNAEVQGFEAFIADVQKGQTAWETFYQSMLKSIQDAQTSMGKIRQMISHANPHNAAFVQVDAGSLASEIKSDLEYRFYDTIGVKPILSGLVEIAAKGITTDQFYKISHTMDLIDNFLADRRNNLIEDNEYETTLSASLVNSLNDSVTATKSEEEIVNGLVSSLDTRIGLLSTAVTNAVQLATYAAKVLEARNNICENFSHTYFNHVRRYNDVRLTIAELSNTFDDEYKDFESFIQKKMIEQ